MPLPATTEQFKLTDQQVEDLQSEDAFLRGSASVMILNGAVKETGVVVDTKYVFKQRDRGTVEKALHATFELIGGVPKMVAWADNNQTEFYRIYAKLAPTESIVTGGGNTLVVTQMPESELDSITIKPKQGNRFVEAEVREG